MMKSGSVLQCNLNLVLKFFLVAIYDFKCIGSIFLSALPSASLSRSGDPLAKHSGASELQAEDKAGGGAFGSRHTP